MLYFQIDPTILADEGRYVVTDVAERLTPAQHDSRDWLCRWDFPTLEVAEQIADNANKRMAGRRIFAAVDSGPYVSPRFDVVRAPQVDGLVEEAGRHVVADPRLAQRPQPALLTGDRPMTEYHDAARRIVRRTEIAAIHATTWDEGELRSRWVEAAGVDYVCEALYLLGQPITPRWFKQRAGHDPVRLSAHEVVDAVARNLEAQDTDTEDNRNAPSA